MAYFFIEMGQGIAAIGDLKVTTSTLHSCTFIAGYNEGTKRRGAFHYPANGLNSDKTKGDLSAWLKDINPTDIISVCGMSIEDEDYWSLYQWLPGTSDPPEKANGAAMQLTPKFQVFTNDEVRNITRETKIEAQKQTAGVYSKDGLVYTLYGENDFKIKLPTWSEFFGNDF
ncbi:MAG: hypothetical protein K1X72_17185 [Pyrinomonadaceae bacterium]|nr:hypothetical protein [Pyrinomonadaceae bacterium]